MCLSIVAPKWLEWTSWTPCSSTCGPHATRKRSRSFITGRHGGDDKPSGKPEEVEYCSSSKDIVPNWGSCPVDARHGKWNPWPACSKTCFEEGSYPPTVERIKKCIPEIPSDNPDFNLNIITCDTLQEIKESKPCEILLCPGRGHVRYLQNFYGAKHPSSIPFSYIYIWII